MPVTANDVFSPDYATARRRFQDAAARLGWQLEEHPIDAKGPSGEPLAFDVARSVSGPPASTLVISSGIHGVEAFLGSAVQLALLRQWADGAPPPVRCVFLHGLNPYGFAWLRRFDERNVDPNRNFLLPDERFEGAPPGYELVAELLNPPRPPSTWDPFALRAAGLIARHGMAKLRQAVASGQYEFPRGLFFGGDGPSQVQQILADNLPRWLRGSEEVVHLDFHTGLGPKGTWKLLIDYPLTAAQQAWLGDRFGEDSFETTDSSDIVYDARGGFGQWCVARGLATNYRFVCAEFGTYGPLRMLAGLRAENQAHHWSPPESRANVRTKRRLKELFCPSDPYWRTRVLDESLELASRAGRGLLSAD